MSTHATVAGTIAMIVGRGVQPVLEALCDDHAALVQQWVKELDGAENGQHPPRGHAA